MELHAGPLRMQFENGELRILRVGGREVVRRIYAAVRDRNWGTVPGELSNVQVRQGENSFEITFHCSHANREVDFAWQGSISGDALGRLVYRMQGAARRSFWKNRIGLCVLIPPDCAGGAARVVHSGGQAEDCRFPELVDPRQPLSPFEDLRELHYQAQGGAWVALRLEGDLFELEDQRNWSDASFKLYGTPLRAPIPVEMAAGAVVEQAVRLALSAPAAVEAAAPAADAVLRLALKPEHALPLPEIGLSAAPAPDGLSTLEIARLRALRPAHLRVDLDLTGADWEVSLENGLRQSRALAAPLWLGLVLDENSGAAVDRLAARINAWQAPAAACIVLAAQEAYWGGTPLARLVGMAQARLYAAQWAGGTRADLIFLLRSPAPVALVGAAVFRITPQVHAFDDATLVESLCVQAAMVGSARAAHPGAQVWVSPLELRPGFNAYAAAPPEKTAAAPPQNVDPRQRELFAAAWTAGSLAALAEGGAGALTVFETVGPRGLMEQEQVFPLYHTLADVGEFRGGQAVQVSSSDPRRALGLGLRQAGRLRVIAAYFGANAARVRLSGLPDGAWRLRRLDERHSPAARREPQAYRATGEAVQVCAGQIELTWDGAGTLTLDGEDID